jgi:Tat protein translocase TatB subunit
MFGIGLPELMIILVVGLIVLGPQKLPELAKGIAKALSEFRKATQEIKQNLEIDESLKEIKQNIDGSIKDLKENIAESMGGVENPLKDLNELKNEIAHSVSELTKPVEEVISAASADAAAATAAIAESPALSETAIIDESASMIQTASRTEPDTVSSTSAEQSDPGAEKKSPVRAEVDSPAEILEKA